MPIYPWIKKWSCQQYRPQAWMKTNTQTIKMLGTHTWKTQIRDNTCPVRELLLPKLTCEGETRSVMSNFLWPHGLYSPWNSPGQNTGVGSQSFLQGNLLTRNQTGVSWIARRFLTNWAIREVMGRRDRKPSSVISAKK